MKNYLSDQMCEDLPTKPCSELGTVLVSGATGYIGGRLVPELLFRGYKVRVMVRVDSPEHKERWPNAEIVVADALDQTSLEKAMKGVYAVYYLIHSLLLGPHKFETADVQAARNFKYAAEKMGVKRIIYLGGLGDIHPSLSAHLRSRMEVAEELKKCKIPVTILRAAVVIGSGSAPYEIIKYLINNLPVFLFPSWSKTRCQPISIRDVIRYLVGVLEIKESAGKSYDIGGKDILSYENMLKTYTDLLGFKKIYLRSPVSHIGLYTYLTSLITPVPSPIIWLLMAGAKNEVICRNNEIKNIINFPSVTYKESLLIAMTREEQDRVHSRWTDAYPPAHVLALKLHEITPPPYYISSYSLKTRKTPRLLFNSMCKIGGKKGWFHSNWMWRLRGILDSILLGVSSFRGRRSATHLRINDVIDFWRVEDIKENKMLLLRAEMKLPGKAWLQFKIDDMKTYNCLSVTAYFQPNGWPGKVYWYNFLPFHHFIFTNLIKQIDERS